MLHPLLSSWSAPSPTHAHHSSCISLLEIPRKFWEYLGNPAGILPVPIPAVSCGAPAHGTPPCRGIFLFCLETEPPLCPSLHPAGRFIHGKQDLTRAPQSRELCNTSWCSRSSTSNPSTTVKSIKSITDWSLMEKHFPASFFFAFPSPKGEFTCSYFPSSLRSDPCQAAQWPCSTLTNSWTNFQPA